MLGAPTIITAPVAEPLTLEQVKTFLRIDGSALDGELGLLMVAVREELELVTGQRLMNQVVRVRAETLGDLRHLTVGPVQTIVAIGTIGADGIVSPSPADTFELTGSGISRGIVAIAAISAAFFNRPIFVDLAVGYGAEAAAVPASLRLAMLASLRGRYDEKPADIERLIAEYRINA